MKKSKYYKVSNEQFIEAINTSISIREALRKLDMNAVGAAYKCFKQRVSELGINIDHFKGAGHLKNKTHEWSPRQSLEHILIEHSSYSNINYLKQRLVKENILQYKCFRCNIDTWCNEPISLQLDHINGINDDNRLENLQLLCPNCHSLTPTFAGRNARKEKLQVPRHKSFKHIRYCAECNIRLGSNARTVCGKCYNLYRSKYQNKSYIETKIVWPTNEELIIMLADSNYTQLAKRLGVSDNAIRKRLRHNH